MQALIALAFLNGCKEQGSGSTPSDDSTALHARIILPLDGLSQDSDEVELIGLVEGGSEETEVWWESSLSGPLDVAVEPDEDGIFMGSVALESGAQDLWLYAVDGEVEASDLVSLTIEGGTLDVEILSPSSGSEFDEDQSVQFVAQLDGDGLDDATITWTSSLDGTLSIDNTPDEDGLLEGSTSLSVGVHSITLAVQRGELQETASVTVTISAIFNYPPEIEIRYPNGSTTFEVGEQIYFRATATDTEDGPEDLTVIWRSSIDGEVLTGTPDKNDSMRGNAALSAGVHTITASVYDTRGAEGTDTVTVVVE
jgi:hypothetical protein